MASWEEMLWGSGFPCWPDTWELSACVPRPSCPDGVPARAGRAEPHAVVSGEQKELKLRGRGRGVLLVGSRASAELFGSLLEQRHRAAGGGWGAQKRACIPLL